MKLVAGGINGVYLDEILRNATPYTTRVDAAVAYAHDLTFFDFLWEKDIPLTYYGLLGDDEAVALPILKKFLERASTRFRCRLVRGHFHSKVIWWRGYGAYIGSANLTSAAWWKNIECGVFYEESELVQLGLAEELEKHFDLVEASSVELRVEILDALRLLDDSADRKALEARRAERMEKKLAFIKKFAGLSQVPSKGQKSDRRKIEFLDEWNNTLQLLRTLAVGLERSGRRPAWLTAGMPAAVHLDQMLHAYYEQQVRGGDDEGRSVEKVEAAHERNKSRQEAAFGEAVDWWCSLGRAPDNEDIFIERNAPRLRELLGVEGIGALTEDTFVEACGYLHAFRNHARQVKSALYGLPQDYYAPLMARTELLARWVWKQPGPKNRPFKEILTWVLHGPRPAAAEERLWSGTHDPDWMVEHFGLSSYGEAIGWSQPERYPPRNNRTNKALRALGYDVKLYYGD